MSRYYDINIGNGKYVFTNQVNGKLDPGALQVILDLYAAPYDTPGGQSSVTIRGVPLQPMNGIPGVSQASDLNNLPIVIRGGMQAGLPFATADASQSGILIQGNIFMAFGNWQGVNQSIELVVTPGFVATQSDPANITFSWKKGTPLAEAIRLTLTQAFPTLPAPVINISPALILGQDEAHYCETIEQFSTFVFNLSQSIITTPTYQGVKISPAPASGGFTVSDGSNSSTLPVAVINFVDLIGQPTWLGTNTIGFSTVMRADLAISSMIQMPELALLQAVTNPQSQSQARNKAAFQGTWQIGAGEGGGFIHHQGDSRGADATAWISSYTAFSTALPRDQAGPGTTSA